MWRKILKYRSLAKDFSRIKIGDGKLTSFWYDNWCTKGSLMDITGRRGIIDLGILDDASVNSAIINHRPKRHRPSLLNDIEELIADQKRKGLMGTDQALWKGKNNKFKTNFSSKETWNQIRERQPKVAWSNQVWFRFATPKFSFCTWLAFHDRLSTGDRMKTWKSKPDPKCCFCQAPIETQNHLFFSCPYSAEIWKALMGGILRSRYTTTWSDIVEIMQENMQDSTLMFLIKYTFQATLYNIWRERNSRRHGEKPTPSSQNIKYIDKMVRNRISSIRRSRQGVLEDGLERWFATR